MTVPDDPGGFDLDRLASLAARRTPIRTSDGVTHKMIVPGDRLAGRVTEATSVETKYGTRPLLRVNPVVAISGGEDVAELGETMLWCSGAMLNAWFDDEQPEAGDVVDVVLEELKDVGRPQPMKMFTAAIERGDSDEEQVPSW
jgi:hypothetical protein